MHNEFTCQLLSIHPLTETVAQFYLQPTDPAFSYEAGQYIELISASEKAYLSIANAPTHPALLEFHLFHAPDNPKAQSMLLSLAKHPHCHIRGPFGHCTLSHLNASLPIIFLARGTGFAPIKAILEILLPLSLAPIFFYWSIKTAADLYLLKTLQLWQSIYSHFHFEPIYTQEIGSHYPPQLILKQHPNFADYQVYVSGPKPLALSAFQDFSAQGLIRERFFSDVMT